MSTVRRHAGWLSKLVGEDALTAEGDLGAPATVGSPIRTPSNPSAMYRPSADTSGDRPTPSKIDVTLVATMSPGAACTTCDSGTISGTEAAISATTTAVARARWLIALLRIER
jgi:hypothetical protein